MRLATTIGLSLSLMAACFAGPVCMADAFLPEGRIHAEDVTVLMAADTSLPAGVTRFQSGGHGKFGVDGWTRSDQFFHWDITVPAEDNYTVHILARQKGGSEISMVVSCAGQSVTGYWTSATRGWDRLPIEGALRLPAGKQCLSLAAGGSNFAASLLSVELVRPAVRERLAAAASSLRADTTWLQQAGFGLMCHWTSESYPRSGARKPYAEAVAAFDVEGLANQVKATGAGFLVLTTSHAEMHFPAPIRSLERILPGRTAERDLVADLAQALGKRGIKLMLYYHPGSGSDPAWLHACGFWETDTRRFFGHWTEVIREIGERYGDNLAGWWFDDGTISYYYRSAPWEALTRAAKAGNPQRLVGFNPWELPSATAFQDFFCGEGHADPAANGLLALGGDGRLRGGSHHGLQACATLITEKDWGHFRADRAIGAPKWTTAQLTTLLREFAAHRNVPIFNVEIYQDGTVSPETVELFRQALAGRTGSN